MGEASCRATRPPPADTPPIGCNDDIAQGTDIKSRISFNVTVSQTYYLQVGGWNAATGSLVLNLRAPNDTLANATTVPEPLGYSDFKFNTAATETGEPAAPAACVGASTNIGATVWYKH